MNDYIINRSPGQNVLRVQQMRAELFELGYSVVTTVWLNDVMADADIATLLREHARARWEKKAEVVG